MQTAALAEIATDAVRAACRVCEQVRREMVTPESIEKKDKSPVTVADLAAQAVVAAKLKDTGLPMVAEEEAGVLRDDRAVLMTVTRLVATEIAGATEADVLRWVDVETTGAASAGRFWTLDPIDGTKGFLRGGHYAVALGLIEDGSPVLGALGCPELDGGTILLADETGCRVAGGRACHVARTDSPASARLVESVESGHSSHDDSSKVAEKLGISTEPVRMDSQAKYAAVAMGQADVYLRLPTRPGYEERIWDHAAGALCVTAAGGRVTDVDGEPLDFGQGRTLKNNTGVIATSGAIHDEVVAAVREVLGR